MDFPSNSHNVNDAKSKKPIPDKKVKEPIQKIVTSDVIKRKTPISKKFKNLFLGGEVRNAGHYVVSEVLVPALRNLVVDTTKAGIERVIYGDAQRNRRPDYNSRSRVSYNSVSSNDRIYGRDPRSAPGVLPGQPLVHQQRRDMNELIIKSRNEAEMVVEQLTNIIDKYDVASVADLYDMLGLPSNYVDNDWGWISLSYVNIRQTREGFVIDLPNPEPIKN